MTSNGITNLRKQIDGMIDSIQSMGNSRPTAIATTSLQEARMWLGESLGELGLTTPYEDSLDPTNEKIAPEADTNDNGEDIYRPGDDSRIKHVKELRAAIVSFNEKVRQEMTGGESNKRFYKVSMSQAYVHLANARMWLGKELDRIDRL